MKFNLLLNHIIRILLVSLLCIMLLIGSIFVIPPHFAFADSSADITVLSFSDTIPSRQALSETGLHIGTWYYGSFNNSASSLDDTNVYFCEYTSNGYYYFLMSRDGSSSSNLYGCRCSEQQVSDAPNSNVLSISLTSHNTDFDIYYTTLGPFNTASLDSSFSSIEDALSGVRDYIDNPPVVGPDIEPRQAIVTIEPGYVAYIGVTGGSAIFTATFNKKQPKGSIISNIRYGFSSSRPPESSTITMDSSVGSMIPFVTDRPFDIWGKSFNGRYGMSDLSASYLFVYVPLTDPDGNTNATVKVALSEYLNAVQFPLSASMVGGDIVSTGNSDEFYISDSSMINEEFRPEYVYSNGGTTSPAITIPVGGNNLPPSTGGGSLIEQFTTLLSDLINRIESLLIAPVEYIKWIISSSSNFMAWLSAIWTWLPEPVYTTIVSVLLILVVVGALKLLWR